MCYWMKEERYGAAKESTKSMAGARTEKARVSAAASTPAASHAAEDKAHLSFIERIHGATEGGEKEKEEAIS